MLLPRVLYWPLDDSGDGLRGTVMVTVIAERVPVLSNRTCSSANQGLLLATAPVAVTIPPVGALAIVSATAAVLVVKPVAAAETVTFAVPSVADELAMNVTDVELPVVDAGF